MKRCVNRRGENSTPTVVSWSHIPTRSRVCCQSHSWGGYLYEPIQVIRTCKSDTRDLLVIPTTTDVAMIPREPHLLQTGSSVAFQAFP